jgi:anti-sigma B factor antagonist
MKAVNFPWRRTGTITLTDPEVRAACHDTVEGCRVDFSGKITTDSSPGAHTLLLQRLNSVDCRSLTVDLYDVEYIDTSGLAMLIELLRHSRLAGKTLQLSGLREQPRYLLESTGLLHLFRVVDRNGQPGAGAVSGGIV